MFALNLPDFQYKIRNDEGKPRIFDSLRQRYVVLTPEEWVRQHFVNYLITCKNYPAQHMVNEARIKLYGQIKRCDTVLYDIELRPLVIIQYKAPTMTIKKRVFEQIAAYNWTLRAHYLIVSNGLNHYCCQVDYENQKTVFKEDIPDYNQLLQSLS
jgi:hypothetical protein